MSRGGVRRDAAAGPPGARGQEPGRPRRRGEHDHDHDHEHDEDAVPGEPTEATVELADDAAEGDVDVTDEVVAAAENEVPGEPTEADDRGGRRGRRRGAGRRRVRVRGRRRL